VTSGADGATWRRLITCREVMTTSRDRHRRTCRQTDGQTVPVHGT